MFEFKSEYSCTISETKTKTLAFLIDGTERDFQVLKRIQFYWN